MNLFKIYSTSHEIWKCFSKLIDTEWHIYASVKYAIFGSDNGLSPIRYQAIIWTKAGLL